MLAALALFLLAAGCGKDGQLPYISFAKREAVSPTPAQIQDQAKPLRVSLASITSPKTSLRYYRDLLDLLKERLGHPLEVVQSDTYVETNELLRTGGVDLAFVCSYAYVRVHDEFGAELVAVPEVGGKTTYRAYVIVRQDSGLENFGDLRGKRFAFVDPLSTTGYLYPLAVLKLQGAGPADYFGSYIFTYSHDNSIKAVVNGVVDAASVESLVFEQFAQAEPALKGKVRVIQESPEFAAPPVVVRPGLDPELKDGLRRFFLTLHEDPRGREILSKMGIDRYREVTDAAYASVRALGTVVAP